MKVHFIKLTANPGESFIATEVKEKRFSAPLHYHPEIELTLILEGTGKRFVGDSIEDYSPGDLVLVGENVPHFWRSSSVETDKSEDSAMVIQFNKSFLGDNFFKSTGANHIDKMIYNSQRGICFGPSDVLAHVKEKLLQIIALNAFEKTLTLLEILNILGNAEMIYLASPGFKPYLNEIDMNRMNKVYNYVYYNAASALDVSDVAKLLNMSVSAFCHFFKKRTKKTFTQFINETRIGNAKRLLVETDKSIAEIAFQTGYNSLSNFNKQFLFQEKLSPKTFRQKFLV